MDEIPLLKEVFNPGSWEQLKACQDQVIKVFREMSNNLYVLKGQREAEAIPVMAIIVEFMERLLKDNMFIEIFKEMPEIINYLIDSFFPDLTDLIFKAGMFPNITVLDYTVRFLELYMLISVEAFKQSYPYNIKAVDTILCPEKPYFATGTSTGNTKHDVAYCPFGDGLGVDPDFEDFVEGLKEGDMVDAVKSSQGDTKMIWSRGIVTDVKQYNIYISFLGENQSVMKERLLKKAPFLINKYKSRSTDFEWRENLAQGQQIDLFQGKHGWLLFEIEESIEQYDNKDTFKFVIARQVITVEQKQHADPSTGEMEQYNEPIVNVHDPLVRKPGTYSKLKHVPNAYCNEEIYELSNPDLVAVYRPRNDFISGTDSLKGMRFYIRLVNIFALNGGFDLMRETLEHRAYHCAPVLVGHFMSILSKTAPYLLNRFVQTTGRKFAKLALNYVLNAPVENLKNLSKEVIESIHKGIEQLTRRVMTEEESKKKSESFMLRVAMIFVSTDNLERKIHGVSILGDIAKRIKGNRFDTLGKKEFTAMIEKDNILEQIIKGHSQLITKSVDLFKTMFEEDCLDERTLNLFWSTLRKSDLETRNALTSLLNDVFAEFSPAQAQFFVKNIGEIDPKQITSDEIDLLYKIVSFNTYQSDKELGGFLRKQALKILWRICINSEQSAAEVMDKTITRLISLIKTDTDSDEVMEIIDEAVENVRTGKAVLQSLKIIRKMIVGSEKTKADLVKYLLEKNILANIFEDLGKFKAAIKEKAEKSGIDMGSLSELTINQFVPTKYFNFEKNILKRLRFIDFIIYEMPQDKDRILTIIKQIWDELVINSLIEAETSYFKKWFVKFSGKEAENLIDKEVLYDFFFDKIKTLSIAKTHQDNSELLKTFTEIFLRLNLLANKIEEKNVVFEDQFSSMFTDTKKDTIYVLTCNPNELVGVDAFWDLLMNTKDNISAEEIVEFLCKLYVPTELDGQDKLPHFAKYIESFMSRCSKIYTAAVSKEGWEDDENACNVVKRVIMMLKEIIDLTESLYDDVGQSVASFYRGDKVSLTIENSVQPTYDAPKKIEMKVYGNTTLLEIKKKIASELTRVTWKNITLKRENKKPDIKEKHNGRTLRDMRVKLGEKLKSITKPVIQKQQEDLVIKGALNPKAEAAFKQIFYRFAKDGQCGPQELTPFTAIVLEQKNITAEDSKIADLISKWDKNNDGKLSEEEFFEFYKMSSLSKPHIVWNNLKNLGYNNDLMLASSATRTSHSESDLAKTYLMRDSELLSKLFSLIDRTDDISTSAWELFNRIPPIPEVFKKILFFEKESKDGTVNWDSILESTSVFKTLYNLYILDYLIEDHQEEENSALTQYIETDPKTFRRDWRNQFIKMGGFVHLIKILTSFIHKGISSKSEMLLFSFLMKSITNYILASAALKNSDIYKNIVFISNPAISLKALIKGPCLADKKSKEPEVSEVEQVADTIKKINLGSDVRTVAIGPAEDHRNDADDTRSVVYGPHLPGDMEPKYAQESNNGANKGSTKSGEAVKIDLEGAQRAKLVETEDFIQLKETLKSINDDSISNLSLEETLKFVATLCENILSKTSSVEFEDINIVKLSMSVFFSLLLANPEFMIKAIQTDEVKLLTDKSTFKIEGYSDLVSFMMAGLLSKRSYIFSRYFNNAFTVVMRESNSMEVQATLVKAVLKNLTRDDLSPRNLAKYIDLACTIIEGICSTEKDPKILVDKSDLNSIINMQSLFFHTLDSLLGSQEAEEETQTPGGPQNIAGMSQTEAAEQDSNLIINHFKLLEKLVQLEPKLKMELSKRQDKSYISRLFNDCLFTFSDDPAKATKAGKELLCKYPHTRQPCYDFIAELTRGNVDNCQELIDKCLNRLCQNLPMVSSWRYTPGKDKKSDQGFLGIVNLHNICYINSMLQQLYMTPAFRYGLLVANDFKERQIVEDKDGRKIDDNMFHQLQKMFAYLDNSERSSYHPYEFCYSFKGYDGNPLNVSIQQDTQEFFNIFFDRIEDSLKPTPLKNITKNVFGGKMIDLLACTSCGHLRESEQMFYNLSLEVKNMRNVNESLDKLTHEDVISDFKCENCQEKCDVTKRPLIKECPNVLIVYLSRLIFDLECLMNVKINTRFEFPVDLNLKNYTYDNYLATKVNSPDTGVSRKKSKESATETGEMAGELGETQTEDQKEKKPETVSVPAELSDEDYEYTLAGVLVHSGHAEAGHYYSYINVNRKDPKRPKLNTDQWVEYNDTVIREFSLNNLEEECFGSGGPGATSTNTEEFDLWDTGNKLGTNWGTSSGRSAYILVYEKKKKSPITLEFNKDNIDQKEAIIKSFVMEEERDKIQEKTIEEVTTLTVPYYGVKKYVPQELDREIQEDNYRFLMEQHVYSKEFLNFICKVSAFPQLGDFNPKTLEGRMISNKIPQRMKDLLASMYNIQTVLFQAIVARTEDNECVDRYTHNMLKIISLCPEHSEEWFKRDLFYGFFRVESLLVSCPDGAVRRNIGEIVAHLLIVYMNYFKIELDLDFDPKPEHLKKYSEDPTFFDSKGRAIMYLIVWMHNMVYDNKLNYKRMESYFRVMYTLAKNSVQVTEWLIRRGNCIRKYIDFYMGKTTSQYDYKSIYYVHEQALDPCVKMVGYLLNYVRTHNDEFLLTKKGTLIHLQPTDHEAIFSENLYDKLLKENFSFNCYKSLKRLLAYSCYQNDTLSVVLLTNILKNLSYCLDNCVSYLEALKELIFIKDDYTALRREIVFGFPTVLDEIDFQRHLKFGFQGTRNLERMSINYVSSLKVSCGVQTFLRSIMEASEKNESTCYIMITFMLQMVNADEDLFKYLLHFPAPCHLIENLHDWIFWFVKTYTDRERTGYGMSQYKASKLFTSQMKESLMLYEDHILNHVRQFGLAEGESTTVILHSATDIFDESKAQVTTDEICSSRLLSLSNNLIVGSVVGKLLNYSAEERHNDFKIVADSEGFLTLRVVEMRCRVTDSFATGTTNLAIPQAAYTGTRIFEQDVPKGTLLYEFFDFDNQYNVKNHPAYPGQTISDSHKARQKSEKPKENIFHEVTLNSSDEEKDSTERGAISGVDTNQAKLLSSFSYRESHYFLKIAVSNTSDMNFGVAIRLRPIEGKPEPNLYYPRAQMNFNIKVDRIDQPVIYLMKKDHAKPFGDFAIDVIFTNIREYEAAYNTNNLAFDSKAEPIVFEVLKSTSGKKAQENKFEDREEEESEDEDQGAEKENMTENDAEETTNKTQPSQNIEQFEF